MAIKGKLLQVTTSLTTAIGGPNFIVRESSKFVGARFSENALLVFGTIDFPVDCDAVIVPTLRGNRHGFTSPFHIRQIKRQIQNADYLLIHGFYLGSTLAALKYSKLQTVFLMPHGSLEPYQEQFGKLRKYIFRWIFQVLTRKVNLIFMVSSNRELLGVQSVFPRNMVLSAGYGLNIQSRDMNPKIIENINSVVLGSLSRLHRIKRIDLAIGATREMERLNIDAELIVAGSGDLQLLSQLSQLVREYDMKDKVRFVGGVSSDKKEDFFKKINILLVLSDNESFAIVVAESISRGIPVVVRSTVGISDFVSQWNTGVVVQGDDVIGIAGAIAQVLNNYATYSTNCLEQSHKFSWEAVAENWENIFEMNYAS